VCCGALQPLGRRTARKPASCQTGPQQPCGSAQASEVSLGQLLEHRFLELGLRQKLFEARVLLLQLVQPLCFLRLHAALQLPPAVVGRLSDLQGTAYISNDLALRQQLLSGLELADDLLGCVAGSFHCGFPGPGPNTPHVSFTTCRDRTANAVDTTLLFSKEIP